MENSFQTSFIPKKPLGTSGPVSMSSSSISITMVVSVFILVTVSLASGGLYFYNDYLSKDISQMSNTLNKMKESFDKETISELELYNKRTNAVEEILSNHIVLSPLFALINDLTLPSIQLTSFSYSNLDKVFVIKTQGIARDYRSIALQADVFNTKKGAMLKDVIFSNLSKNINNYITFDLEFKVDPMLLSYINNIANITSSNINPRKIEKEVQTEVKTDEVKKDEAIKDEPLIIENN